MGRFDHLEHMLIVVANAPTPFNYPRGTTPTTYERSRCR
jgi:hypothetical protein